ncbi:hypothetical protein H0N96_02125 [Candidatus Micrarchaeota archaeon]|nr:hypothetical protein [Candidatus Micrarchaeota archaeon]
MSKVIKAMVDKGLIAHKHIKLLGKHFLTKDGKPKALRYLPLNQGLSKKLPEADEAELKKAINTGFSIGLIEDVPSGSPFLEGKLKIKPIFVKHVLAYLKAYPKK